MPDNVSALIPESHWRHEQENTHICLNIMMAVRRVMWYYFVMSRCDCKGKLLRKSSRCFRILLLSITPGSWHFCHLLRQPPCHIHLAMFLELYLFLASKNISPVERDYPNCRLPIFERGQE